MNKCFKTYIGVDEKIMFYNGNLKDFLMKSLKPIATSNNRLNPELI